MIQSWNEKVLFIEDDQCKCIEILLDELQELYTLKNAKVLHVGAHEGEEVSQYRRHGFDSIVLIEANQKLCKALENKFTNDADIEIFICSRYRKGPQKIFQWSYLGVKESFGRDLYVELGPVTYFDSLYGAKHSLMC